MTKIDIEICDDWDGLKNTCDFKRCKDKENFSICYHKPYIINGAYYTVIQAITKLFTFAELKWYKDRNEELKKSIGTLAEAYNRDIVNKEVKKK